MIRLRPCLAVLAALGLVACVQARDMPVAPPMPPPAPLPAQSLEGRWSNDEQMALWTGGRTPLAGGGTAWVDAKDAVFARVDAPLVGDEVIYLEWRGADGAVSRQRLWSFRADASGRTVMDFFTFRDPAPFVGAAGRPGAFAALTPQDLVGYGEACALPVVAVVGGWRASIPATCTITARSGRVMRLQAEIERLAERRHNDRLRYRESGVLEDGAFAFEVPGGGLWYEFRRVRN